MGRVEGAPRLNSRKTYIHILVNYGVFIAVAAMFVFFSFRIQGFASFGNIANILRAISITTLIATGITFALSVGGFNLAGGATAGLAGAVAVGLLVWNEMPVAICILAAVLIGVAMGLFMAFLSIRMNIADLLASLAISFVASGLELTYTDGLNIYSNMLKPAPGGGYITAPGVIPPSYLAIGQGYLGPIPIPVVIMLLVALLAHLFLNHTKWGRYFYSIGGNMEAARLAGIPVNGYKTLAYVLSFVLAAVGGVVLTARLGSAQSLAGQAFSMDALAATFIGFAVLGAGKPNMLGTFTGAVFMGVMINGLTMMNVPYTAQDIFKGVILIVALMLSRATSTK